ncbi:class II aldolase/adducin family protein [Mycolicibacterium sphagni]|uniref:Ribulose phosphate epimerase n=1 Tax=Mycolicibacterium sphagni TaxID=1786 RepID=A0A255E0Y6_9MYCO|nr:class II aldolase/adducin family protein [Mycolicibacterium sphagni]OYN83042.1 ribulose phosphate epimerase [Mycolicibacterium sphagni]
MIADGASNGAFLDPDAAEPLITDGAALRAHRKRRLALAYRVFGAMGWGSLGDGHISARDPERLDCFWLGRYGVPFRFMTPDDLVLVGPDGSIEGGGHINIAAYYIHAPLHEARPDVIAAAHCHTPYGTPFSAAVTKLAPISQEACAFFDDHEIFDDEEVNIGSTDGGKRIAAAIGETRAAILRNHGLLTVGASVDAAVGYFLMMERSAEVQVKARDAKPIGAQAARRVHDMFDEREAWQVFQWAQRTYVPDAG